MTYAEKKKELEAKYAEEIGFIERKKDSLPGVAWDKLDGWARGLGPCPFINEEELKKDVAELLEIAKGEAPKAE